MKALLVLLAILISLPAGAAETRAALRKRLSNREARVLFVGNSYSFKVPAVIAKLAKERGKQLVIEQATKGGWTLQKHAGSKETLEKIRTGNWDLVVFQGQSQMPSFGKGQRERQMNPFAKTLAEEARKAGAQPVFFLTWGRRDGDRKNKTTDTFSKMQNRLETGYTQAAAAAGRALVVPVGKAWAVEMNAGKGGRLYAKDGSHPSAEGVKLSAEVFVEFFYGK